MDLIETIIVSLITGAIASVVASYIFRVNTSKKIPVIKVSDKIIKSSTRKGNSLVIKMVNETKRDVINIKTMIVGVKYRDPDVKKLKTTIALSERDVPYLAKDENEEFGDNVMSLHLYSNDPEINIHDEIMNHDELILFIRAEDPYNNAFAVIHKTFSLKNDLKDDSYTFHESRKLDAIKKVIK